MLAHRTPSKFCSSSRLCLGVGIVVLVCAGASEPATHVRAKGQASLVPDAPESRGVIRRELFGSDRSESLSETWSARQLPSTGAWSPPAPAAGTDNEQGAAAGGGADDGGDAGTDGSESKLDGYEPAKDPDLVTNSTPPKNHTQNTAPIVEDIVVTLSPEERRLYDEREEIADLKKELNETQEELNKLEEKLEKETNAVSYVFLCLWVVVIMFFYLAHAQNEDLRYVVNKTLSDALGLFCGVLIFYSMKDLMDIVQHKLFSTVLISVSCFRFLAIFFLVEWSLNGAKGAPKRLAAWGKLGAYILGFASVDAFGSLQETYFSATPAAAYDGVSVTFLLLVILCGAAKFMRFGMVPRTYGQGQPEAGAAEPPAVGEGGETAPVDDPDRRINSWLDQCERSENEAMAFVLGLLLSQCVRFQILGFMPPLYGGFGATSMDQLRGLLHAAAFFGLLMVPCQCLKAVFRGMRMVWSDGEQLYTFALPSEFERYVDVLVETMGMAMAWCLLFLGTWLYKSGIGDSVLHVGARMTVKVSMAFCFTIFGLVFSLVVLWNGWKVPALVNAIVFLIGLTWEKTFMEALSVLDFAGVYTLTIARIALVFYVLPAWYCYLLPKALPKDEVDNSGAVDEILEKLAIQQADAQEQAAAAAPPT